MEISFDEQNDESSCLTKWSWFQAAHLRNCAVKEFFNIAYDNRLSADWSHRNFNYNG